MQQIFQELGSVIPWCLPPCYSTNYLFIFSDMAETRSTRQATSKNLVKAEDLPTSDLPTLRDVLAKMLLERQ